MEKKSFIKDIVDVLLWSSIITFILLKFIIMPCRVEGKSMMPIIHDNDFVFSSIISRKISLNRFDICIIKVETEGKSKMLVKRLIGLPNEKIEYISNRLFVDGNYIAEDYLDNVSTEDFSISLKEDEYYFLGDNRTISKDSRFYGTFNSKDIISKNIFVWYPFERFGVKR